MIGRSGRTWLFWGDFPLLWVFWVLSFFCGGVYSALLLLRGHLSAPPVACIITCNYGVTSPSRNWYDQFPWSFYKEALTL